MNIDQARALARKAGMIRAFRDAESMVSPLTNQHTKFIPPAPRPFFQNNGLLCVHCRLVWEECKPCRRTEENAQLQTVELRRHLGIEGFDL